MAAEPVSEEARARMREGFECWNSGEIDLMVDMYDPEAEFDPSLVFPDTAPVRGRDALLRYMREIWEVWEGIRMDPLDLVPAGSDSGLYYFVVPLRLWGKGKRSGVEIDQQFASLYTVKEADQLILRNQVFPTVEAAMAAAAQQTKETS